jgi:flagellar biosynthesis/type III secretory pathway protein FliH
MLLGELPDLEETQSGKDLIHIGEQRGLEKGLEKGIEKGIEKGLAKAILVFLTARHGTVPAAMREKIATLSEGEAERLIQFLPQLQTLDALAQRLG